MMMMMTPEMANKVRWEREMNIRNAPWTLEDLDEQLPSEGYKILDPPAKDASAHVVVDYQRLTNAIDYRFMRI